MTRSSSRLSALDGMRAVAVLMVFVFHGATDILPGGFVGVDIFFVISGFVITGILVREHSQGGRIDLVAFWKRRMLRLIPALLAALVLVAVLTPTIGYGWRSYGKDALTAVLYVYNFRAISQPPSALGHLWSLSVEEQFYVVWPLLVLLILRARRRVRTTLVLALISFIVCASLVPILGGGTLYFLLPGHVPELLLGAALSVSWTTGFPPWLQRIAASPWLAISGAVVLGGVALTASRIQASWLYLGGLTLLAVATTAVIAHIVQEPGGAIASLLSLQPLVWLGLRSYGFYLLHQPLLLLVEHFGPSVSVRLAAGLAASLILCASSYRYVEQPFLRRKLRYSSTHSTLLLEGGGGNRTDR